MDQLTWISHPAKLRKQAAIITIFFIMVILAIIYAMTKSWIMVVLGMLIFTGSLSTFFYPTRNEITADKVKIKYMFTSVEKDLSMFRSYYPDKRGVLLSPFIRPSRLENFRGIYLRYHDNKGEVDSFIKRVFENRQAEKEPNPPTEAENNA
jgi:hypothetical protein